MSTIAEIVTTTIAILFTLWFFTAIAQLVHDVRAWLYTEKHNTDHDDHTEEDEILDEVKEEGDAIQLEENSPRDT